MLNALTSESLGIYTLIIHTSEMVKIRVGKLGLIDFPVGYYTYTGSALGRGALSLGEGWKGILELERGCAGT